MSVIATAVRHLLAAGVTGEALVSAIADMEASRPVDAAAEKRRAYDRERKRAAKYTGIPPESAERVEKARKPIPPNDIYSNPPENPDGAKAPSPPFSEKVVSVWNDGPAARGATKATSLDAGRRKALAMRVRDHSEAAVLEAIGNLAASEFHCGKNDRGWRVNIGWMLKSPENFVKALEMGGGKPGGPPATPIDHAAYLAKLNDKPWLRGNQTETPAPSRNPTHGRGPTAVGDLIHRITDHAA